MNTNVEEEEEEIFYMETASSPKRNERNERVRVCKRPTEQSRAGRLVVHLWCKVAHEVQAIMLVVS